MHDPFNYHRHEIANLKRQIRNYELAILMLVIMLALSVILSLSLVFSAREDKAVAEYQTAVNAQKPPIEQEVVW